MSLPRSLDRYQLGAWAMLLSSRPEGVTVRDMVSRGLCEPRRAARVLTSLATVDLLRRTWVGAPAPRRSDKPIIYVARVPTT